MTYREPPLRWTCSSKGPFREHSGADVKFAPELSRDPSRILVESSTRMAEPPCILVVFLGDIRYEFTRRG